MRSTHYCVGIDLGGTKTEIIVLGEGASGHNTVLYRSRVATPAHDYQAILSQLETLFFQAQDHVSRLTHQPVHFARLGLGAPGTTVPETGLIKNANTTCLIGQPLETDLSQRLGVPVKMANDANCLVLSEATDGAAAHGSVVLGVILGTGVGGGIAINRQIISGRHGIAGEWGHNPLWQPQMDANHDNAINHSIAIKRPCYCGRLDCVETYLSGPGFVKTYESIVKRNRPSDLTVIPPHVNAQHLIALMRQQTPEPLALCAREAFDHYVNQLAMGLAGVINVLDPDVIVLGGGMSNVDELYAPLSQRIKRYVFTPDCTTPIVKAMHGDSSGVRGAAWLSRSA